MYVCMYKYILNIFIYMYVYIRISIITLLEVPSVVTPCIGIYNRYVYNASFITCTYLLSIALTNYHLFANYGCGLSS